jgi:hypothetical protein
MLSNEELLIVLWWQINFDRDQKAAAINQTNGCGRLFGHIWSISLAIDGVKYFTAT